MPTKFNPTAKQLGASPRLYRYERSMLIFCSELLRTIDSTKQQPLYNAVLESCLLHVRNIFDFFSKSPRHKDDIKATDFLDMKAAASLPALTGLKRHISGINKHLSHLSYTRAELKPSWDTTYITKEIDAVHSKFLELLPKGSRAKWDKVI